MQLKEGDYTWEQTDNFKIPEKTDITLKNADGGKVVFRIKDNQTGLKMFDLSNGTHFRIEGRKEDPDSIVFDGNAEKVFWGSNYGDSPFVTANGKAWKVELLNCTFQNTSVVRNDQDAVVYLSGDKDSVALLDGCVFKDNFHVYQFGASSTATTNTSACQGVTMRGHLQATIKNTVFKNNVAGLFAYMKWPSREPHNSDLDVVDFANHCSNAKAVQYAKGSPSLYYHYKNPDNQKDYVIHKGNTGFLPSCIMAYDGTRLNIEKCQFLDNVSSSSTIILGNYSVSEGSSTFYEDALGAKKLDIVHCTVTGSTFKNNMGASSGGAIFVDGAAICTLKPDNVFDGNVSAMGGAIATYDGVTAGVSSWHFLDKYADKRTYKVKSMEQYDTWAESYPAAVLVEGGIFRNNIGQAAGGAIYISSKHSYILGGTFTDNRSQQGGAIYVSSPPQKVTLFPTLIENNSAKKENASFSWNNVDNTEYNDPLKFWGEGGGIWVCDTGYIRAQDNSLLVKNNESQSDATGPDYYAWKKGTPQDPDIQYWMTQGNNSAERIAYQKEYVGMLYKLFIDGKSPETAWPLVTDLNKNVAPEVEANWQIWSPTDNQWKKAQEAEYKNNKNNSGIALKTDIQDPGHKVKTAYYPVVITGNRAGRGGGLGANGGINIDSTVTELNVVKKWVDKVGNPLPADEIPVSEVLVQLTRDGIPLGEPEALNAANGWKIEFNNLQQDKVYDDGTKLARKPYVYDIKEISPVENFTTTYNREPDKKLITITNKRGEAVNIPVEKLWKTADDKTVTAADIPLAEVQVALYADGKDTGKKLVLNAANNWKGAFKGVPAQKEGAPIVYTVQEVTAEEGFSTTIAENENKVWVVTNKLDPPLPTPVLIRKVDSQDKGLEGATFDLYRKGSTGAEDLKIAEGLKTDKNGELKLGEAKTKSDYLQLYQGQDVVKILEQGYLKSGDGQYYLLPGDYYLTETAAPKGYAKLKEPFAFTLDKPEFGENGLAQVVTLKVTNKKAVTPPPPDVPTPYIPGITPRPSKPVQPTTPKDEVPKTGERSPTTGALLLVTAACALLVLKKSYRQKQQ